MVYTYLRKVEKAGRALTKFGERVEDKIFPNLHRYNSAGPAEACKGEQVLYPVTKRKSFTVLVEEAGRQHGGLDKCK